MMRVTVLLIALGLAACTPTLRSGSPDQPPARTTPAPPPAKASQPRTAIAGTQLALAWDYPAGALAPDAFTVERAPGAGTPLAPSGPFAALGQVAGTARAYADATVTVGTAYCYRVIAQAGLVLGPTSTVACGFIPPAATNPRLSLTFPGSGRGTVTSIPPGISCETGKGACAATFPENTLVTLTERPGPPWWTLFVGWGGPCAGNATPTCQVVMTQDLVVPATFVGKK